MSDTSAATPRHHPENVNRKHRATLTLQDRIALAITSSVGTMYAVYAFGLAIGGWMVWQSLEAKPFDPYPFAFLLFLGNIVQLLLMPLIMVGQNIQGRHTELRADEEYRTTASSFRDIEEIKAELKRQSAMLEELMKRG